MEDWSKRTLQSESLARKRSKGKGIENKIQPRKLTACPWTNWRLGSYFRLWEGLFSGAVLVLGSVKVGRLIQFFLFFLLYLLSQSIIHRIVSIPNLLGNWKICSFISIGAKKWTFKYSECHMPLVLNKQTHRIRCVLTVADTFSISKNIGISPPTVRGVFLVSEMFNTSLNLKGSALKFRYPHIQLQVPKNCRCCAPEKS